MIFRGSGRGRTFSPRYRRITIDESLSDIIYLIKLLYGILQTYHVLVQFGLDVRSGTEKR